MRRALVILAVACDGTAKDKPEPLPQVDVLAAMRDAMALPSYEYLETASIGLVGRAYEINGKYQKDVAHHITMTLGNGGRTSEMYVRGDVLVVRRDGETAWTREAVVNAPRPPLAELATLTNKLGLPASKAKKWSIKGVRCARFDLPLVLKREELELVLWREALAKDMAVREVLMRPCISAKGELLGISYEVTVDIPVGSDKTSATLERSIMIDKREATIAVPPAVAELLR